MQLCESRTPSFYCPTQGRRKKFGGREQQELAEQAALLLYKLRSCTAHEE